MKTNHDKYFATIGNCLPDPNALGENQPRRVFAVKHLCCERMRAIDNIHLCYPTKLGKHAGNLIPTELKEN
jgi:hypothetical protein